MIGACEQGASMPSKEAIAKEMQELKDKGAQTICLGRFLVDVPKDAVLEGQSYHYINRLAITPATKEQVRQAIAAREREINAPNGYEHVVKKVHGAKPDSLILVRRLKDYKSGEYEIGYNLEGYFWMGGRQYLLKSKASSDKLDLVLNYMLSAIALATPRLDNEIPDIPGFCMEGGFFPGIPQREWHYEEAVYAMRFTNHPDVQVRIHMDMNNDKVDESLLTRMSKFTVPEEYKGLDAKARRFRRGQHPVGDRPAEEIVESLVAGDSFYNHQFNWEASGKPEDIFAPNITVVLGSGNSRGGAIPPSITDAKAIALFDFIVDSIRVRPTK
jgi:hypothetical protein